MTALLHTPSLIYSKSLLILHFYLFMFLHFWSPLLPYYSLVSYLPCDSEVILSLAAGSDDQVSLVQGLHRLLCLVETYIVEVEMGNHTLYIRC